MSLKIDKNLVRQRFESGFSRYDKLAVVQNDISIELAAMIPFSSTKIFEIGAGTGFLTRELAGRYPDANWVINDLSDKALPFIEKYLAHKNCNYIWGDAETVEFPTNVELIASSSTVQWFENLPEFLSQCYQSLSENGVLALSTFGPTNFHQLKTTTGEGLDYYSLDELNRLLTDAGFEILKANEQTKDLVFDSPIDVLRHVKATGVNSLSQERWGQARLARFEQEYRLACPSEIRLTYHPILIIAKK